MTDKGCTGCKMWIGPEEKENLESCADCNLLGGIMFLAIGTTLWFLEMALDFPFPHQKDPFTVIVLATSVYFFCAYALNLNKLKKYK